MLQLSNANSSLIDVPRLKHDVDSSNGFINKSCQNKSTIKPIPINANSEMLACWLTEFATPFEKPKNATPEKRCCCCFWKLKSKNKNKIQQSTTNLKLFHSMFQWIVQYFHQNLKMALMLVTLLQLLFDFQKQNSSQNQTSLSCFFEIDLQ